MLPKTHKLISEQLYYQISYHSKAKISLNHLIMGSISPDFAPKYKIKRHYMSHSFDFVIDLIQNLYFEMKKVFYPLSISSLSYRLGVITHYISDYFCIAHNDHHYRKNLYDHYNYEKEIHNFFMKPIQVKIFDTSKLDFNDKNSIKKFILDIHLKYVSVEKSFINDAVFTLNIITSLVLALLRESQIKSESMKIRVIA